MHLDLLITVNEILVYVAPYLLFLESLGTRLVYSTTRDTITCWRINIIHSTHKAASKMTCRASLDRRIRSFSLCFRVLFKSPYCTLYTQQNYGQGRVFVVP